jgi:hypothetical protein
VRDTFVIGLAVRITQNILVTLPHGKGCIWPQEFLAEDLGEEDIVGHVLWFEAVAADGSIGASEVAWFPGLVKRAEGGRNVLALKLLVVSLLNLLLFHGLSQFTLSFRVRQIRGGSSVQIPALWVNKRCRLIIGVHWYEICVS